MKARAKNALMTALWWLILWAAAFGLFLLMFAGVHDTGDSDGSGFLPITLYAVNYVCYIVGAALSIAVFVLLWRRFLRQTVPLGQGLHPGWTVLWVVQALLGLFGVFVIWLICVLMKTGLFSGFDPGFLEYYGFVYPIAAALAILVDVICIARTRKE